MGEFGAVSVVTARVSGVTNTLPLEVATLYNDSGCYTAAFAVASLLAMLGLGDAGGEDLGGVARGTAVGSHARESITRTGEIAMSIEVRNISKTFGDFAALKDVSLTVRHGELVALLGPSGSGKTTLLRIIAGLEQPDAGSGPILFHDEDVAGRDVGSRQVGFVFQHYALFRHMTVFENVAFGLRVRPRTRRPRENLINVQGHAAAEARAVGEQANRYPHQLSGGQRQRVALARALAIEPKVLLLDEPFGALDAQVRQELRQWLRRLHDEIHLTSVFVTHDQDEALELADRVLVMNDGRIEQIGTPDEVFHNPATRVRGEVSRPGELLPRPVGGRQGPFRRAGPGVARSDACAPRGGAGLRPPARVRSRHPPQRPSGLCRRDDADPFGRSQRAAGTASPDRRSPSGRSATRPLSSLERQRAKRGLRVAAECESLWTWERGLCPGRRYLMALVSIFVVLPRKK